MRGLSASIVGELLMAVIYPSGVQASGSQSFNRFTNLLKILSAQAACSETY